MKHCHWLILYDICDPKRLRKIEKITSQYGIRVQKSVFESDVSEDTVINCHMKLKKMTKDNDYIVIIPLCEKDWQKSEKYGTISLNSCENSRYVIL